MLAAARRFDRRAQSQRVGDDDRASPAFDEPAALHGIDFARDGFPPRVDAGREFGLVRRRHYDRAFRIGVVGPRESQELGVDAGANVELPELPDPAGALSQPRNQGRDDGQRFSF